MKLIWAILHSNFGVKTQVSSAIPIAVQIWDNLVTYFLKAALRKKSITWYSFSQLPLSSQMTMNWSAHMHTLCHWTPEDATSDNLYTNYNKRNVNVISWSTYAYGPWFLMWSTDHWSRKITTIFFHLNCNSIIHLLRLLKIINYLFGRSYQKVGRKTWMDRCEYQWKKVQ